MSIDLNIGFFGAGKMAAALGKGFVKGGLVKPSQIMASDPEADARAVFCKETGSSTTASNLEVAQFGQVLILAVKPDQALLVLSEIGSHISGDKLLLSIAAGITLRQLEQNVAKGARVVRAMPNTAAIVGASATAFALGKSATAKDGELTKNLFSSVGIAVQVKEPLLDAVTGLSGSGPAYVFMMIEALSDAGVAEGLPRAVATSLAAQTLAGGAKMVLETGLHPGALKDMVASPGGTTIEGIHQLEQAGLRAALINAVRAAADKSRKLAQS